MTDVFEIQDEISQAIVAKLKVKLASPSSSGWTRPRRAAGQALYRKSRRVQPVPEGPL